MKHMYGINLVFDIGSSSTIFQGIFLSFFFCNPLHLKIPT